MWERLLSLQNCVLSHINQMERHHWMIAAAVVVTVGAMCMRGFGSRTNY
jgi:hypothetical protein